MRSSFFTDIYAGPEPGVRREAGINDARRGKPRLSNDRDYLKGYELGLRLKPNETEPATTEVDGPRQAVR